MYKVMYNNMVLDLLTEVCYIRFLPNLKRTVITDSGSANGIMGSDKNTVYHLNGTANTFINEVKTVDLVKITKEEFDILEREIAMRQQENQSLRDELQDLKATMAQQNDLIAQLLAKLG